MGSGFILTVRICQKPLNPFFYQGTKTFIAHKSFLCKSSQLPVSARYLCTTHSKSNPGSRKTDGRNTGQGPLKKDTIRHRQEELWSGPRGKSSNFRQKPSFPNSVFAAGTAKRASEVHKRQVALLFQDDEQLVEEPKGRSTRGGGRTYKIGLLLVGIICHFLQTVMSLWMFWKTFLSLKP